MDGVGSLHWPFCTGSVVYRSPHLHSVRNTTISYPDPKPSTAVWYPSGNCTAAGNCESGGLGSMCSRVPNHLLIARPWPTRLTITISVNSELYRVFGPRRISPVDVVPVGSDATVNFTFCVDTMARRLCRSYVVQDGPSDETIW